MVKKYSNWTCGTFLLHIYYIFLGMQ